MKAKQVLGCVLSAAMVTSCLPGTAFAAGAANKPTDGGKEAVKADDTAGKIVSETTGTKENGSEGRWYRDLQSLSAGWIQ